MSNDGRAQVASVSDEKTDGVRAAGTFPARVVGTKKFIALDTEQRGCLAALVRVGRMIRRTDGSYGTATQMLIPNGIASMLKTRRFAIAGFNSEIVPSDKGRRAVAEESNAPTT